MRLPSRARIILLLSASVLGVWATDAPQARQNPVSPVQVPRIVAPRIVAPRAPVIGAPDATVDASQQQRDVVVRGQRRLTAARAEAFVEAARRGLDYLPGEVVVKFKTGMGPAEQQQALAALASQPQVGDLEWHGPVAVVRDTSQPDAYLLAQHLNAQPEVEYAEPNFIARIDPLVKEGATPEPSSRPMPARATPFWARLSGTPTDADYGAYQWNFSLINMPKAWDIQPGGRSDLIVAVIDTGITAAPTSMTFRLWTGSSFQNVPISYAVNPDLPASRLVLPRDYAFLDPQGPVVDMDGHGTHVSGTIGQATNNGVLVAGMAYNVKIMPVKVCVDYWEIMITRAQAGTTGFAPPTTGGCLFADVADGIKYAVDNGAKVMNISLGGPGQSTPMRDALAYAVAKGAFVAISMGNDYETGNAVSYPARYAQEFDGVMSVASVAKNEAKAYYSSTGPHCEIAAPGGDSRQGSGTTDRGLIWQSTLLPADMSPGQFGVITPRFDRYDKQAYQGTSMASPHVAGLAALIMSQMPGVTPAQVEKIIRATAKDIGSAGKDDFFGFGLIQPRAALFGLGVRK